MSLLTIFRYKSFVFLVSIISLSCDAQKQSQNKKNINNFSYDDYEMRYVHENVNIRNGRGLEFDVITVLKKGDEVRIISDSTINNWSLVYQNENKLGYAYYPLLKNLPLINDYYTKQNTTKSNKYYSISGKDNGYKWNNTDYSAKMDLCRDLARILGEKSADFYYGCLEDFYDTSDKLYLNMAISEVVTGCIIMDDLN